MAEENQNNLLNYKEKYLKYKKKYIILKQLKQNGNGFWDSVSSSLMKNPSQTTSLFSIPGLQSIQRFQSVPGIQSIPGSSGQDQMMNELKQFITPENTQIFFKLVASLTTHIFDPRFYPMLASTIKSLLTLFASVETANPFMALSSANNALINMKATFPKEFVLLKEFFKVNRVKILQIINQKYPGIINDQRFDMIMEFLLG